MEQILENYESGDPRDVYDPSTDLLILRMDAFIARMDALETMLGQVLTDLAFIRDILAPRA